MSFAGDRVSHMSDPRRTMPEIGLLFGEEAKRMVIQVDFLK